MSPIVLLVAVAVAGTADDRCIVREVENYESGAVAEYEFSIDVDDGIDYDEAGPGSLAFVAASAHYPPRSSNVPPVNPSR